MMQKVVDCYVMRDGTCCILVQLDKALKMLFCSGLFCHYIGRSLERNIIKFQSRVGEGFKTQLS